MMREISQMRGISPGISPQMRGISPHAARSKSNNNNVSRTPQPGSSHISQGAAAGVRRSQSQHHGSSTPCLGGAGR